MEVNRVVSDTIPTNSIGQLPPEILFNIFTNLKNYAVENDPFSEQRDAWDWTIITNVCRNWHATSLTFPSLWSDLRNYKSPRKTRAFLERSREADLVVLSKIGSDSMGRIEDGVFRSLKLALECLHRIRSLDIDTYRRDTIELLQDLLDHPAPRLQTLNLRGRYGWEPTPLPSFPEPTPALRNLRLTHIKLPSRMVIGPGLAELQLNWIDCMTLLDFFSLLESCPALKTLCLSRVLWKIISGEIPDQRGKRDVHLSNLEFLKLEGDENHMVDYDEAIRCLTFPDMARLNIRFLANRDEQLLDKEIWNRFKKSCSCRCGEIDIKLTERGLLVSTICGRHSGSSCKARKRPSSVFEQLWLGLELEESDMLFSYSKALIESCYWKEAKYVRINIDFKRQPIREHCWLSLLSEFSSIKCLQVVIGERLIDIEDTNMEDFLRVLTHQSRTPLPEGCIICPKLENLLIISKRREAHGVFDILLQGLQIRKEMGMPMKELAIRANLGYGGDLRRLSGLAEVFCWNGERLI